MVRGEQIGGINLDTKMDFNIKKAEHAKNLGKTVSNNTFLVTLLESWKGSKEKEVEGN